MSRRSVVIILIALALLLIAATIRSGWLYLASSALISLVIVGLFSGWLATRRMKAERECPAEVFQGELMPVSLRVRNTGGLTCHFINIRDMQFAVRRHAGLFERALERRAELEDDMGPGGKGGSGGEQAAGTVSSTPSVTVENLGPGKSVQVDYRVRTPRRGIYDDAELLVKCGGVFGSAEMKKRLVVPSPVAVFPKIDRLDSFALDPSVAFSPNESYEWTRKGIGQDYYGVREYTHGDSLRHVHWKTSARQGRLIVREYQKEFRPEAGLVVLLEEPTHGDVDVNSLEDGLRAAASIANYYAVTGSLPLLAVPRDGAMEFAEGNTLGGCLKALAAYRPCGGIGVAGAISFALGTLPAGCAVSLVTNLPAGELARGLELLPVGEQLSVVLVLDDSYSRRWGGKEGDDVPGELSPAAAARLVNLYVVTRGRGIGGCLSEPLSITAE